MKLIVGLGNPGNKYNNTWHNAGFMAVDKTANLLCATQSKKSPRFLAEITTVLEEKTSQKIILAKPLTFMNQSGKSVALLSGFYKIGPNDIIVLHDDLDLPLGKIRISSGSSAGGHNGIKSIIECLNTNDFCRIRIGVATERKKYMDAADYVISKLTEEELDAIEKQTSLAATAATEIVRFSISKAMNEYN